MGTYIGTINCDGNTDSVTVTIIASSADSVILEYETIYNNDSLIVTYEPIITNGCELSDEATSSTLTVSVNAVLDGDNLSVTEHLPVFVGREDCVITAIRN